MLHEILEEAAVETAVRQVVELEEYALFHLSCGFVGESHGKDAAIGSGGGVLNGKFDVFQRQVVGFTRTCRGFIDE